MNSSGTRPSLVSERDYPRQRAYQVSLDTCLVDGEEARPGDSRGGWILPYSVCPFGGGRGARGW